MLEGFAPVNRTVRLDWSIGYLEGYSEYVFFAKISLLHVTVISKNMSFQLQKCSFQKHVLCFQINNMHKYISIKDENRTLPFYQPKPTAFCLVQSD